MLPLTILLIFLKAIKYFIDLKSEINLTSLTTKFINNKLKPKQHPQKNPCKIKKKKKKKNPKPILTSLRASVSCCKNYAILLHQKPTLLFYHIILQYLIYQMFYIFITSFKYYFLILILFFLYICS